MATLICYDSSNIQLYKTDTTTDCNPVSINIIPETNINLHPNPCVNELFVYSEFVTSDKVTINIINSNRSMTYSERLSAGSNLHPHKINVQKLRPGLYFIEIAANETMWVKKFIVIKGY